MKKIMSLILSLVMILSFTACGTKAEATWQEHYDLGLKYVNEAKYDEAVLAFTKALEIDPKQAPVYIALAEVYVRQENYTAAQETLDKAITEIGQTDELLAEKEKLDSNGEIPQMKYVPAPSVIPPQSSFAPTADAVPGVVRTERQDRDEELYTIMGYDANEHNICQYNHNKEDDSLDFCWIYTLNADGRWLRGDCYREGGNLWEYEIRTYDENGNEVRVDKYWDDGSLIYYWINTINENGYWVRSDNFNADGSLDYYEVHTYDADGRTTGYTKYNPSGSVAEVVEY